MGLPFKISISQFHHSTIPSFHDYIIPSFHHPNIPTFYWLPVPRARFNCLRPTNQPNNKQPPKYGASLDFSIMWHTGRSWQIWSSAITENMLIAMQWFAWSEMEKIERSRVIQQCNGGYLFRGNMHYNWLFFFKRGHVTRWKCLPFTCPSSLKRTINTF